MLYTTEQQAMRIKWIHRFTPTSAIRVAFYADTQCKKHNLSFSMFLSSFQTIIKIALHRLIKHKCNNDF